MLRKIINVGDANLSLMALGSDVYVGIGATESKTPDDAGEAKSVNRNLNADSKDDLSAFTRSLWKKLLI